MRLTKSQKDALVRKAMSIINEKMEAKREELRKNYKPSKKAVAFLARVKKFFEARTAYYKAVEEAGQEQTAQIIVCTFPWRKSIKPDCHSSAGKKCYPLYLLPLFGNITLYLCRQKPKHLLL